MPSLILPQVPSGLSIEELSDIVAKLSKEIEWIGNGFLDSKNIRNIAGFNVGNTELKHISGIVGMSGANPSTATAVRFWAGHATPTAAPFRVQQDGKLFASNADITGKVTASSGAIGGWVIGTDSLMDASGTVGFSSAVTAGDDVRMWAGSATPSTAPFRVTESGAAFASNFTVEGGVIRTAASNAARIELSGNSLRTYNALNALSGFAWGTAVSGTTFGDAFLYSGGSKSVEFYDNIGTHSIRGATGASAIRFGGNNVPAYADGTWNFAGPVSLPSSTSIGNVTSTEISYLSGVTSGIQSQLNGKAASFSGVSGTVYVAGTSGGPVTTAITFSNGVRTS